MLAAPVAYTYVDPRERRRRWSVMRLDVEARWMAAVLARLKAGPALTHELATAAEVEPGDEYGHFMALLKRHAATLRVTGKQAGPTGHPNKVWELA